jgi:hypothetical protein
MKSRLLNKIETRTSHGLMSKGWYIIDGEVYLVKGNSIDYTGVGYEPYSEVLASRIAKKFDLDCVEYKIADARDFDNIDANGLKHVSICKSYMHEHSYQLMRFHDYAVIVGQDTVGDFWSFIHYSFDEISVKLFYDMILLDAIIGNCDRHLNNWDIIITNGVSVFAPLIDFGASLLSWSNEKQLKETIKNGYFDPDNSKPFKLSHLEQVRLLLRTALDKCMISKIIDKQFEIVGIVEEVIDESEDIFCNFDDLRRNAVKGYLRKRSEVFSNEIICSIRF